jgi:hypothetical protein
MINQLYRKVKKHLYTKAEQSQRSLELFWKLFLLLALPMIPALLLTGFWHIEIFNRGIHLDGDMENIISAAWIPTFGILYSLLAASIFGTVWTEYKTMRTAVKRYDLETFIDLRDEELSPLVRAILIIFSLAVLIAFMSMKYSSWISGDFVILTTAYLFSTIYLVISEIDDPCGGIWYIKHIPEEWLEVDPKKWRKNRHTEEKKKFHEKMIVNGVHFDSSK